MLQEKALARAKAGTGAAIDFSGTWINELKSEAVLVQANNVLSGTYLSAVSSDGTQTTGDLQGYIDGDLISFVVHWRNFQAITAWVGQLDPAAPKETINTLWQMTKQVSAGDEWASINAGADYFTRKP
ncbi:MAG: avidin/streptavidin family protein [Xanthobacteraceae bacterium]|nr:avidin/streptavidin family protein [Xanthobacteraceae bacterium]